MKTAKPVALGKRTASLGDGVTARITSVRQRYVKAQLPGQLSGASVIFNVVVDNGSSSPLDLNAATVTVTDADGAQASQITSAPAKRLPDLLQPGASGTGTYVFIVPKGSRNPVDVNVTINAQLAVVVFHGDVG